MSQLRQTIEASRHWKGWRKVRAVFWSWVYDTAKRKLDAMRAETRGLVGKLADADTCPYEVEIEKPG